MTTAPTISTQRLTLRGHVMADFEPLYALLGSERAAFMGGPFSRKQSWHWIASEVGSWPLLGYGSWGVQTHDGVFVGQVGINKPADYPEMEIGWVFLQEHEGKGYAYEAAEAALAWAWQQGFDTLVSYITPGNDRSVALAERLGALLDKNAPLPLGETPDETIVYRHTAPDSEGGMEAYA
ncbi:MAG: GNAT family N-acetyltransferase [Rhodobacteraceae bacterium]|nr:GNAT family N-acetyltransferase [Paracoccaceae bacterium]